MYAKSTNADLPNNDKFSNCSIKMMKDVMKTKATCFSAYTGASACGNGVVEEGVCYSCDLSFSFLMCQYHVVLLQRHERFMFSGFYSTSSLSYYDAQVFVFVVSLSCGVYYCLRRQEDCDGTSKCCTANCKFAAGAVCSPDNDSCCTSSCQLEAAGVSCRTESM